MKSVSYMKFKRLNIFIIILFSINIVGCSSVENTFLNNATHQKSVSEQITESTIITFPDKNLEKTIREALQCPTCDILLGDVNKITNLENTKNKHITNLSGIENFINLSSLNLRNNQISNIEPLEGLTKLTDLDLSFNEIISIDSLKGLTKLTSLNLYANKIKDYSPVYAYYKNLKSTDIASEVITPQQEFANVGVQVAASTVIPPKQKPMNISNPFAVNTFVTPKYEPINVNVQIAKSRVIILPNENSEKLIINTIQPPTGNILKDDSNKIAPLENAVDTNITDFSGIINLTDLASLNLIKNQIKDYYLIYNFYKTLKSTDIVSVFITPKQDATIENDHVAESTVVTPKQERTNVSDQVAASTVVTPKHEQTNVSDQISESTVVTPKHEQTNVSDQVAESTVVTTKQELTNLSDQIADSTVVTPTQAPPNVIDQVADSTVVTPKHEPTNVSDQIADSTVVTPKHKSTNVRYQVAERTVVTFPDKNLEKLVRDTIQHPTGDILKSDVNKISNLLNAENMNITNLSGIENFTNLTSLNLSNNQINNIEPLKELTNLTKLNISKNQIKADDIQSLQNALPECDVN